MIRQIAWGKLIYHITSGIVAVLAVTTISYLWRIPQKYGPLAVLGAYFFSTITVATAAFVIFRKVVRTCYSRHHLLSPFASFLQMLIWGVFFALPCIYNPYNWAWTQSHTSHIMPALGKIGWSCIWTGLFVLVISLTQLGLRRSFGQPAIKLEKSGLYRLSRNPQLMGGTLIIIGYTFFWPSWYVAGWVALFALMVHLMVLTEEEHLRVILGEDYVKYCQRVPRYLGIPGKLWKKPD